MSEISAYQENAITTQTQGRLIVLLYEGAIKFLKQSIAELEAGNMAEKGQYISKALDIINELDICLDVESGGEVAVNLRRLYDFMRRHLTEGNLNRDPRPIRDVITCLEDLLEGWRSVVE
ncbi:MAG: flagellar export chaperone FliS [Planctomycetota bacterium]|jgi:flagellar protein FliS